MLRIHEPPPAALDAYADLSFPELIDEVRSLGAGLRGARVVHVNSTSYGGGVAELLSSVVPLLRDVGVDASWQVMRADAGFFAITKKLHNALQGAKDAPSHAEIDRYLGHAAQLAASLDALDADLIVLHDPQPIPARSYMRRSVPAVARVHIDSSAPHPDAAAMLLPHLRRFDAVMFSLPQFALEGLDPGVIRIAQPAIDPFSVKNAVMSADEADKIVRELGADPDRPLLVQVSRFDPWKDPLGVIAAFRKVREEIDGCQLVLAGSAATDDPEAAEVLAAVNAEAGSDPDILVLSDGTAPKVGAREVNAFQTAADVVVQKSLKEGFGLTVAEAMWKGTPVIGGDVGGIRTQIEDGRNGFLVGDVDACAERAARLLRDAALRERMGRAARESVTATYLMPRLVRDHLRAYRDLLSGGRSARGEVD